MTNQSETDLFSLAQGLALRTSSADVRDQANLSLLRRHLLHATTTPFYRQRFQDMGFTPDHLETLEDFQKLPLTNRQDIDLDPAAFVPSGNLVPVDIALTSGTTGEAVVVPYTQQDLKRLAFNEMMAFHRVGIKPGDKVQLCVTLDRCFIAGLAYYSGVVMLGGSAIRSGPGKSAWQWELIRKLKPVALVGVPSFLLYLARWGREHGFNPHESGIKSLVTIGEPIRKSDMSLTALGEDLQEAWGAKAYASYGATELETAFCDCSAAAGGHVHPELIHVEIVDDEGNNVEPGEPGEVVVTPLGVQGFPLVRFRTGDIARLHVEPCACGWQTPRLGPIEGRLAQRLKFKGTTLYPETIFQVLAEIPEVAAFYVEAHSTYDLADEVKVIVGTDAKILLADIEDKLQARLRVRPEVIVQPTAEVMAVIDKEDGRKQKKFFDLRKVS
ncbi:MAG: AMP-binding protein [Desulfobulbaceae bacterium]|nr:AMP-binding protein [Desulfobulbaceae bacterium]